MIDLPDQVTAYSAYASGVADPNALYVIMIGGNDVRDATLTGTGEAAIDDGVAAEKPRSRRFQARAPKTS